MLNYKNVYGLKIEETEPCKFETPLENGGMFSWARIRVARDRNTRREQRTREQGDRKMVARRKEARA